MPQDVVRDPGLVDAGILVRLQVYQGFFGEWINFGSISQTISIKWKGAPTFNHDGFES